MRRVLFILSLFMLVCGCIEARTIIVEIGNIRGNHGNILVMAQSGKDTKPVYGIDPDGKKILIETRKFNPNRDYLWAIPLKEIDLSQGALKQNPGWD